MRSQLAALSIATNGLRANHAPSSGSFASVTAANPRKRAASSVFSRFINALGPAKGVLTAIPTSLARP